MNNTVSNKFSFKKLSADKKAELIDLQNVESDQTFVFNRKLPIIYWVLLIGSLIWFGNLFMSTQELRWETWMIWLNVGVNLLAAFLFTFSLAKIVGNFTSKKRNGYVFTPDEFIKVKDDCVQVWNLQDIEAVQVKEDMGILEVWQGTDEETVKFDDFSKAKRLEDVFDKWKPSAKDNFAANLRQEKFAFNQSSKFTNLAMIAIASIAVAAGLSLLANHLNTTYDDGARWNLATRGGTLADYEEYLSRHPKGLFAKEANEKISASLSQIKTDYEAKPKIDANAEAVAVMNSVLSDIIENGKRTIYVKVTEDRKLDPAMIEKMKMDTGMSIENYDYSAPAANEKFRKEKIFNDIGVLLRNITQNGVVKLETSDALLENEPSIEVNYTLNSADLYYRIYSYSSGSSSESIYPAVEAVFDLTIKSADAGKNFSTAYTELPGNIEGGMFRQEDAVNYSFDKLLFGKISENLSRHLEQTFGLN